MTNSEFEQVFEDRRRFEDMLILRDNASVLDLANRVIPADDWTPDMDVLSAGRSVAEVQADTESWWAGVNRMREQGHFLP